MEVNDDCRPSFLFDKLDTMKAKTVLAGSVRFSEDPIILPLLLYVKVDFT